MKVLVTGASGFLGSHLAQHLAGQRHTVRVLLRRTSNREFLRDFEHEVALGDVTDAASLPPAVEGVEAVVHAAGLVKARTEAEFAAVNAGGTENLLRVIEAANPDLRRFVHISSLAAHGPSPDGSPRPVAAPASPVSAYGRTKLAGEELIRSSGIASRSVIIRPPVIYGPRDPALVPFFQLARFRVAPLLMGGQNRISIVYVADIVHAVHLAVTSEADVGGKIYCPEDGAVHTWRDLLSAVEGSVGRRAVRLSCPRITFEGAALASEAFGFLARRAVSLTRDKVREMAQSAWVCSSQDLRRDLGWEPLVDIRAGASKTGAWYREHHWI